MTDRWRLAVPKRVALATACLLVGLGGIACQEEAASPEQPQQTTADSAPTPEEITQEDFIAEADAICLRSAQAISETESQYTPNTTKKQSIRIEGETDKLVKERLAALEELEAPADLADDYEGYLDLRRRTLEIFEKRTVALKKNDKGEMGRLDTQIQRLVDRLSEEGREIGFFACANRLPKEAEREVIANLKEYFTEPGERTCRKLATRRLIEALAETDTPCPVALLPSKKVTVDDVGGVEGVRAEAAVVANAYNDTQIDVDLLYEKGTYRINGYEGRS